MQILFHKKDMDKNIEFTKKMFDMNLKGKIKYFDTFQEKEWERILDKKMNLEKFVGLMENCNFFVSGLSIAEDKFLPFRYYVNAANKKKDKLLEIHCDLTGENFSKVQTLYYSIYGKFLQDAKSG